MGQRVEEDVVSEGGESLNASLRPNLEGLGSGASWPPRKTKAWRALPANQTLYLCFLLLEHLAHYLDRHSYGKVPAVRKIYELWSLESLRKGRNRP